MKTVVYDYQIFSYQKFGGVSRYFCEIASRIQRQPGWSSRVIAPLHFNRYLAESDVSTEGFYVPAPFAFIGRVCNSFNRLATPFLLRNGNADFVHQTYYSATRAVAGTRLIVTVFDMIHELFPQYFPSDDPVSRLKQRAVEVADHVICISHQTAEDLMRILGVHETRLQ